jgi:hypothetical protein
VTQKRVQKPYMRTPYLYSAHNSIIALFKQKVNAILRNFFTILRQFACVSTLLVLKLALKVP